jgi:hypothetical protein
MHCRQLIEAAWNDRALFADTRYSDAVEQVLEELDKGSCRVAEKN